MPFKMIYRCTDCGQDVDDIYNHDCPNPHHDKVWEDWIKENAPHIETVCPSVPNHPDEIAFHGQCFLHLPYDEFWGDGEPYTSRNYTNPTWGEVLIEFEKAIIQTGDYHHSFLEGLNLSKKVCSVPYVEFSTGS